MERFTSHTGIGVPLRRTDVDTDQILPGEYLKRVSRTGFDDGLFAAWRDDESFVLNELPYAGASILVAGHNFGTGSSREHAVWALQDYGFKAVLAPSFGDIFQSNAGKAGLLAGKADESTIHALWAHLEAHRGSEIVIDLEGRTIATADGGIREFLHINDYTRRRLLDGLDEISITLTHDEEIQAYESTRVAW